VSQLVTNTSLDIENLTTEDDTPVDNLPSEKQQRLLVEPLYSSWGGPGEGRQYLAAANVGLFSSIRKPPLVPDVFLSLDVTVADDWWEKSHRTYLFWEFGKPPDVVVEIVSNKEGNELGSKLLDYARMKVTYYVVYDPLRQVQDDVLAAYELRNGMTYERRENEWLRGVGLGLTLWDGVFEKKRDTWLRWCDEHGAPIPTGAERAEAERGRAEAERERAEAERERAEAERERAERLAERLRALGEDPDRL
jgi:Uma2 family endonuclease